MAKVQSIVISTKKLGEKVGLATVKVGAATAELKYWQSAEFAKLLTDSADVSIESFKKPGYNGGPEETWIRSVNDVGEKAQQGGFKGGGGFKGNPRTPQEGSSIVAQVLVKAATEVYNAERRLEFEAAKHNADQIGGDMKWSAKVDSNAICGLVDDLADQVGGFIAKITPAMEGKSN